MMMNLSPMVLAEFARNLANNHFDAKTFEALLSEHCQGNANTLLLMQTTPLQLACLLNNHEAIRYLLKEQPSLAIDGISLKEALDLNSIEDFMHASV